MENKRHGHGGSSATSSLDHLFGPKDSSSSSSSSSSVFCSIFSPPSTGLGRDSAGFMGNQAGGNRYGNPGSTNYQSNKGGNTSGKDTNSSLYQNETVEPCYFSSSIYYGGQENFSPRTKNSESHHTDSFNKEDRNDDPYGNNANSASRGNWWQGSLYY